MTRKRNVVPVNPSEPQRPEPALKKQSRYSGAQREDGEIPCGGFLPVVRPRVDNPARGEFFGVEVPRNRGEKVKL